MRILKSRCSYAKEPQVADPRFRLKPSLVKNTTTQSIMKNLVFKSLSYAGNKKKYIFYTNRCILLIIYIEFLPIVTRSAKDGHL